MVVVRSGIKEVSSEEIINLMVQFNELWVENERLRKVLKEIWHEADTLESAAAWARVALDNG